MVNGTRTVATVSKFRVDYDPKTKKHDVYGPKAYMEEWGFSLLDRINAGQDTILNNTAHLSPNPAVAVLVRLQTDYAAWRGMRLTAMREPISLASSECLGR